MKYISVDNNDVASVLKQIRSEHKEKGTFMRLKKFHRFRKTPSERAREKKLDAVKRKISDIRSLKKKSQKIIITDLTVKNPIYTLLASKSFNDQSSSYIFKFRDKFGRLIGKEKI